MCSQVCFNDAMFNGVKWANTLSFSLHSYPWNDRSSNVGCVCVRVCVCVCVCLCVCVRRRKDETLFHATGLTERVQNTPALDWPHGPVLKDEKLQTQALFKHNLLWNKKDIEEERYEEKIELNCCTSLFWCWNLYSPSRHFLR